MKDAEKKLEESKKPPVTEALKKPSHDRNEMDKDLNSIQYMTSAVGKLKERLESISKMVNDVEAILDNQPSQIKDLILDIKDKHLPKDMAMKNY